MAITYDFSKIKNLAELECVIGFIKAANSVEVSKREPVAVFESEMSSRTFAPMGISNLYAKAVSLVGDGIKSFANLPTVDETKNITLQYREYLKAQLTEKKDALGISEDKEISYQTAKEAKKAEAPAMFEFKYKKDGVEQSEELTAKDIKKRVRGARLANFGIRALRIASIIAPIVLVTALTFSLGWFSLAFAGSGIVTMGASFNALVIGSGLAGVTVGTAASIGLNIGLNKLGLKEAENVNKQLKRFYKEKKSEIDKSSEFDISKLNEGLAIQNDLSVLEREIELGAFDISESGEEELDIGVEEAEEELEEEPEEVDEELGETPTEDLEKEPKDESLEVDEEVEEIPTEHSEEEPKDESFLDLGVEELEEEAEEVDEEVEEIPTEDSKGETKKEPYLYVKDDEVKEKAEEELEEEPEEIPTEHSEKETEKKSYLYIEDDKVEEVKEEAEGVDEEGRETPTEDSKEESEASNDVKKEKEVPEVSAKSESVAHKEEYERYVEEVRTKIRRNIGKAKLKEYDTALEEYYNIVSGASEKTGEDAKAVVEKVKNLEKRALREGRTVETEKVYDILSRLRDEYIGVVPGVIIDSTSKQDLSNNSTNKKDEDESKTENVVEASVEKVVKEESVKTPLEVSVKPAQEKSKRTETSRTSAVKSSKDCKFETKDSKCLKKTLEEIGIDWTSQFRYGSNVTRSVELIARLQRAVREGKISKEQYQMMLSKILKEAEKTGKSQEEVLIDLNKKRVKRNKKIQMERNVQQTVSKILGTKNKKVDNKPEKLQKKTPKETDEESVLE